MPDTAFLEKAELQQILRWLTEIEDVVALIDKETEDYDCMDQCKKIRKILNKMRGFLAVIRD
jgi:hypothetical protein